MPWNTTTLPLPSTSFLTLVTMECCLQTELAFQDHPSSMTDLGLWLYTATAWQFHYILDCHKPIDNLINCKRNSDSTTLDVFTDQGGKMCIFNWNTVLPLWICSVEKRGVSVFIYKYFLRNTVNICIKRYKLWNILRDSYYKLTIVPRHHYVNLWHNLFSFLHRPNEMEKSNEKEELLSIGNRKILLLQIVP